METSMLTDSSQGEATGWYAQKHAPRSDEIGEALIHSETDKKAKDELAKKAGGKGPLNTGSQGIKKSGKK